MENKNRRWAPDYVDQNTRVIVSNLVYDRDHAEHSYTQSQRREVITIDYTNTYRR